MPRNRRELGRCNCSGPLRRTYDWDIERTTRADAQVVREISRGTPGPWVFYQLQVGSEILTYKTRKTPVRILWKLVEVSWDGVVSETDACTVAAWEGGPSMGMEGFGWAGDCVWTFVSAYLSAVHIRNTRTVELERDEEFVEINITRQTSVAVSGSLSIPGTSIGLGGASGIQYDAVEIVNTSTLSSPNNSPSAVVEQLHH